MSLFCAWVATILLNVAAAGELTDRLMIDVAREHAPWRNAPIVFLTDDDGRSCRPVLTELAGLTSPAGLTIEGAHVRDVGDLWKIAGVPKGYVGTEGPPPLERFVRREPRGFVVVDAADNAWGAQLLAEWLGREIRAGVLSSSGGTVAIRDVTFLFRMPEYIQLAPGVAIDDLVRFAVASHAVDGCTYHVLNRLRTEASLSCQPALRVKTNP